MTVARKLPSEKDIVTWDYAPELAETIAKFQLDDPRLALREAGANAFDAERELGLAHQDWRLEITINERMITIEDWGTGIRNYKEFRLQGRHESSSDKAIGRFGLGKLSLLSLGERVLYESNNGKYGMQILMTLKGMTEPEFEAVDTYLNHQGTRITIFELKNVPSIADITNIVRKRFNKLLAKGVHIIINGEEVKHNFKYDLASERRIITLRGGAAVDGWLIADEEGDGKLEVYANDVFIESYPLDPSRAWRGCVNCDGLNLAISRSAVQRETEAFKEFEARLKQEVAKRFKTKGSMIPQGTKSFLDVMRDLLAKYLKQNGWMPARQDLIKARDGDQEKKDLLPDEEGLEQLGEGHKGKNPSDPGNKQNAKELDVNTKAKPKKKDDFKYVETDEKTNRPAIYWIPETPSIIYFNRSHPLQVYYETHRGYQPFMTRYFARIAVQLNPNYKGMSDLEKYNEEDKLFADFLTTTKGFDV